MAKPRLTSTERISLIVLAVMVAAIVLVKVLETDYKIQEVQSMEYTVQSTEATETKKEKQNKKIQHTKKQHKPTPPQRNPLDEDF